MTKRQVLSFLVAGSLTGLVYADHDDDRGEIPGAPEVNVSASDPIAFRGLSTGAFVIRRDGTNDDLAVNLTLSGSASNGVDYATIPSSVTIPAGFRSVGLAVTPLGGAIAPDEWVTLTIATNTNYNVGHRRASVLIKGNLLENQAPTVNITTPANDTAIASHTDLPITAEANDPNDSVVKVSFYANDRFLGSALTAPYTLTWSNVPPGSFALFARAEDRFGKSTVSATVHLSVTNPPSGTGVTLTSPVGGSTFGAPATVPLEAKLSNPAAVVSYVSFYAGDDLLGSISNAPYTFSWSNVAPGSYNLRARATEANGAVSTSEKVKVTVTNQPPSISLTSPVNNSVVAGPADVTVSADVSDANGLKAVTFYGDARVIGSVTNPPYSLVWSNVAPGKHVILAKATDIFGAFSSAAALISVTNPAPAVTLTAPADGVTLTAPATIELTADASDADGLDHVSFWAGNRLLGIDKTAPYTLTLSNVNGGTYTFSAHAVDIYGQRTISAPVKVTVVKVPRR